jgi:class 3 adenylate cyclase
VGAEHVDWSSARGARLPDILGPVGEPLSLAEFLREHPWPQEWADARRLEYLWIYEVDLAPDELWPLVSDVSRMNRLVGNPEMKFVEKDGLRYGETRYSGVHHAWHEVPWDWVANKWFSFLRVFSKGGMKALWTVERLEPLDGGRTRFYLYFGAVPRWPLLTPVMRVNFAGINKQYKKALPELARTARAAKAAALSVPPPSLSPQAEERLSTIATALRAKGLDATAIDKVVELVRTGDEMDLARIQVRERARAWSLDEDALLRVFLHATRAGLLELAWDVVCPHCRGVRDSETKLGDVPAEGECDVCTIEFGTQDAVEVSFRVHPSIRHIEARLYCSAEPSQKQHIRVQRALQPGGDTAVEVDLQPGRYRLRNRGEQQPAGFLDVTEAPGGSNGGAPVAWRVSAPPGEKAAPPHAALELVNDSSEPRTFILEQAAPSDLALRPGRLLSHQEFRDLFSEEFLGADVRLAVGEQTILFTDIVGSTAMYAERGDPDAFVAVRHHFTSVFGLIASHRGAVVKTIGDAAMGAFMDPVDAVRCAVAIQRQFADPAGLRLRVSLNTGSCIAVRLNSNLDYFGHAVNLSAKLQSCVEAGQVVVSTSTYAAPGVAAHLKDTPLEELTVPVKGLKTTITARRWNVS